MYGNSFWALTDKNDDILCFKNYGPKCPLSFSEDPWTCLSNMDTKGDPNWLEDQNVDLQCVSDAQTARTLNNGCCQAIIIGMNDITGFPVYEELYQREGKTIWTRPATTDVLRHTQGRFLFDFVISIDA